MSAPREAERTYEQEVALRNRAAQALYQAELAVHDAHQTHVDEWIRAAHDRLHVAVTRYAVADARVSSSISEQPRAA
jgi:hypothetical protein